MNYRLTLICVLAFASCCYAQKSATEVLSDMYDNCLSKLSYSCVKPRALQWISDVAQQDQIKITNDLSIIKTGESVAESVNEQRGSLDIFNKIDNFMSTHSLRVEVPEILKIQEARSFVPESYLDGGLANGLEVPLGEKNLAEGRGFVKKVMIPFLIGLKFKSTVLVPIALALIALKTWKAVTLGLLSIVLSGAMVIFKLAKPKVVNYEVVHYPHHHDHHIVDHHDHHIEHALHHDHHLDHHIDHHIDAVPHVVPNAWEPHQAWGRQFDGQDMAYAGQL